MSDGDELRHTRRRRCPQEYWILQQGQFITFTSLLVLANSQVKQKKIKNKKQFLFYSILFFLISSDFQNLPSDFLGSLIHSVILGLYISINRKQINNKIKICT